MHIRFNTTTSLSYLKQSAQEGVKKKERRIKMQKSWKLHKENARRGGK